MSAPNGANRRSALITGASRGIGLGIAEALAEQEWALTINSRGEDDLARVKARLERRGAVVDAVAGDLVDDATVTKLIERHGNSFGSMDALILAAGIGWAAPLAGYPMRRFDKQFAVNIRTPFALVTQSLPLLRHVKLMDSRRCARVIGLASIEGLYPERGLAAYSASKAALLALVASINAEESGGGVCATAVSPAFVDTEMSAWVHDRVPAERMIKVADVVKVVSLVLSLSSVAVIPNIVLSRAGDNQYGA